MKQLKRYPRRIFIKRGALVSTFLPFVPYLPTGYPLKASPSKEALKVYVFSKHLQFLNYQDMALVAADIGFDGVELTVRKRGHVLPENVTEDLPKSIEAIKESGLMADMIVTGITELNPQSRTVLETAAGLGVKHYRLGYFRYPQTGTIPDALQKFNQQVKELAAFNDQLGLQGCYQNHSGTGVGANIWDVWKLLQGTEPRNMGAQYDIRHAVVEGGHSWPTGLRLIKDHIANVVIKDFRWEKIQGKWQIFDTTLGQGMVDFDAYFKKLKGYGINVPVSIHYEYDLFGVEHGAAKVEKSDHKKIFDAMQKDLQFVRRCWKEA